MRALHRTMMLATALLLVLAVAQGASATTVVVGFAAVAIAAALAVRYAARILPSGRSGAISFAHRQSMTAEPAPAHPATPGRTRSRAPAGSVPAAL